MSAYVLPITSFPARDIEISRETIYRTTVREATSGREDRTSWASAPRYQYHVKMNALRSYVSISGAWGSLSEVALMQFFIDQHYGNFDSFHITDPYDDSTDRVVRFVERSVGLTRIAMSVWRAEFDVISVI